MDNHPAGTHEAFVERARRSMVPKQERVEIVEKGIPRTVIVERRGVGPLITKYGKFQHFDFVVDDKWVKYSAVVMASFSEAFQPIFEFSKPLIVRMDSGCETGQMFGDMTCECREQLDLALQIISENGQGILINIPRQDGRGLGLPFKLATLRLQDEVGVDTVLASLLLQPRGSRDDRTYSGAVSILKFFGIPDGTRVHLATNNRKKEEIFQENGFPLDRVGVVIQPTEHTLKHLSAKQVNLGHEGLIKLGECDDGHSMSFPKRLEKVAERNNSFVCCGLDPVLDAMPKDLRKDKSDYVFALSFLKQVIDVTHNHVCAYKLQKAFFDAIENGATLLRETIEHIRNTNPGIQIILDAKVGDIENTMAAYFSYFFEDLRVDGAVVNPYMGDDVFDSIRKYQNKAALVLVKTSNVGGESIQNLKLEGGACLWEAILDMVAKRFEEGESVIPVVSSSALKCDSYVVKSIPATMPIFLAGIGAQGGDLSCLGDFLGGGNRVVPVNSSRGILYPEPVEGVPWSDLVRSAAVELKDRINAFRRGVS